MSGNLLEGHNILINIMPNNDKLPFVIVGLMCAFIIGYCFVSGVKAYCKWKHKTTGF